jgi:hypothetical protein
MACEYCEYFPQLFRINDPTFYWKCGKKFVRWDKRDEGDEGDGGGDSYRQKTIVVLLYWISPIDGLNN